MVWQAFCIGGSQTGQQTFAVLAQGKIGGRSARPGGIGRRARLTSPLADLSLAIATGQRIALRPKNKASNRTRGKGLRPFSVASLPKVDATVFAVARDGLTIGTDGETEDGASVSGQGGDRLAGLIALELPQPQATVLAGCDETIFFQAGNGCNAACVTRELIAADPGLGCCAWVQTDGPLEG